MNILRRNTPRKFVDTNIFLRIILKDSPTQLEEVKKEFNNAEKGNIKLHANCLVIFELYWVLTSVYKIEKMEVIPILTDILSIQLITIEERSLLLITLFIFEHNNISIEDSYHIAFSMEDRFDDIFSFDKKLKKIYSDLKNLRK